MSADAEAVRAALECWQDTAEAFKAERDEARARLREIQEALRELRTYILYTPCPSCGLPDPERYAADCEQCAKARAALAAVVVLPEEPGEPDARPSETDETREFGPRFRELADATGGLLREIAALLDLAALRASEPVPVVPEGPQPGGEPGASDSGGDCDAVAHSGGEQL